MGGRNAFSSAGGLANRRNLLASLLARCAAGIVLVCLLTGCNSGKTGQGRVVRVGVDSAPPYAFVDAAGHGRGLVVDLINEAARRRHVAIVWVPLHTDVGLDKALSSNIVDLWPVVGITSDRLTRIHITQPWFQNVFCLVSRRDLPILHASDAIGAVVAHADRPLATEMARRFLPGARLVSTPSNNDALQAMCNGMAAASFIEARTLEVFLLERSAGCRNIALNVNYVKDALSFAGIGAQKQFSAVADELRAEIMNMVSDGTFSSSVEQWASFSAEEMRSLFALEKAQERDRAVSRGNLTFLLVILAMAAMLVIAWRARASAQRARSLEAIRSDVLRRLAGGDPLDHILHVLTTTVELSQPGIHCAIRFAEDTHPDGAPENPHRYSWPIASSNGRTLGAVVVTGGQGSPLGRHQTDLIERVTNLAAIVIEHKALHKELEHEATHDRLTGLANRWRFNEKMNTLQPRNAGNRTAVVFYIDLDHFKHINDALGHQIGDLYLCRAAERIQSCFSDSDLVARIGGDEFTVFAEGLNGEDIRRICGRIIDRFQEPFSIGGMQVFGSASIGVSSWPKDGKTAADIQSNADSALYEAKERGRNQFRIYTPAMRSRAASRMQTEQLVGQALDGNLFELFYQPQVNIEGTLVGMEALVRIRHPEHGLIVPETFIGVAEEAGLIAKIDSWVVSEACRQIASWRRAGERPVRIAINISRASLASVDIAQEICDTLSRTGIEPAAIQIELTESAALKGGEVSRDALRRLKQSGVSLALDDFGTGYSSLSCLHSLPVDTVKIDKSFILHLIEDANSLPLVEAIIAAAKTLGMTVVAEGVENEDQLRIVRLLRCDAVQGNFISPPLQVSEISMGEPLFRRRNTAPDDWSIQRIAVALEHSPA